MHSESVKTFTCDLNYFLSPCYVFHDLLGIKYQLLLLLIFNHRMLSSVWSPWEEVKYQTKKRQKSHVLKTAFDLISFVLPQ